MDEIEQLKQELLMEKMRADQLALNCNWLVQHMDLAHGALCPGLSGTWQDRMAHVVSAAQLIALLRSSPKSETPS